MDFWNVVRQDRVPEFLALVETQPESLWARDPWGEGRTVLHKAAEWNSLGVLQNALQMGLDVSLQDKHGYSALQVACYYGHLGAMEILMEAGSPLSRALHTAFRYALGGHVVDCATTLLSGGADVNERDEWGETPLHAMITYRHGASLLSLLLAHGASPNAQTDRGKTPLHLIVEEAEWEGASRINPEIVRILLEAGADPTLRDETGQSASEAFSELFKINDCATRGFKKGLLAMLAQPPTTCSESASAGTPPGP